jgi:hypothetical protein
MSIYKKVTVLTEHMVVTACSLAAPPTIMSNISVGLKYTKNIHTEKSYVINLAYIVATFTVASFRQLLQMIISL